MSGDETKLTGTVKFFNSERGFGFIVHGDYHDEIFCHISQVADGCPDPLKGDRVEFIADKGRDGHPFARRIVILK
jgi:CspA family cold shock protein